MIRRSLEIPSQSSLFLFGARGTGKTTLLQSVCPESETRYVDLLDVAEEQRYLRDPELLSRLVDALPPSITTVVIDEVQKIPKLLDVVHRKIEESKRAGRSLRFILTGSSARKLRRGAANLLAGRADVYALFPLTAEELGESFSLEDALAFGTLPSLLDRDTTASKNRYLEAYARTYLKEEIWNEHLVRKLDPFAQFLEIAAQMNGRVLNFASIGRDAGVDTKTVQSYFQILEDTLLGFFLPPYHASERKRETTNPKFYFFDTGVKRALERMLTVPVLPRTYAYGEAFEHWVILEIMRRNEYLKKDFKLSYIRTHSGAEVDLVLERPGRGPALVEIKSADRVGASMTKHLEKFRADIPRAEAYLLSLDPVPQKIGNVTCLPWAEGLAAVGL
jgi:predicted AAA+ superfamily ATPase